MKTKTLVVWVSRHEPLNVQLRFLENKLGVYVLEKITETIPSAEFVVEKIKELRQKHSADRVIVVPVLPLSMIARLTELSKQHNFEVWWAEMQQTKVLNQEPKPNIDYDVDSETVVVAAGAHEAKTFKIMRFVTFHRVKAVKLELEPI